MWFITSIYLEAPKDNESPARAETHRTFGYFSNAKEACQAVAENRCNMHECLYNYLVVENIGEGIHPLAEEEIWYKWQDKWVPCSKPEALVGIINWALG
jgi:hypothetical protein